jgi:hypothetical protein
MPHAARSSGRRLNATTLLLLETYYEYYRKLLLRQINIELGFAAHL